MLTITSYLSKTLKILSTFVVPFLIPVVFWPRFLKIGKMLSYMAICMAHTDEPTVTQLTVGNVSAKYVRLMFSENSFYPPSILSYLRKQKFTPSAVYELPFKITIENELRSFQFKLIPNILPTNQRHWKMNVKSSPKCEQCDAHCETISHIFYECPSVKIFWEKVVDWWNRKYSENTNPIPRKFFMDTNLNLTAFILLTIVS